MFLSVRSVKYFQQWPSEIVAVDSEKEVSSGRGAIEEYR